MNGEMLGVNCAIDGARSVGYVGIICEGALHVTSCWTWVWRGYRHGGRGLIVTVPESKVMTA